VDAGQVAALLVLFGVVGVLAAIVGSGIEAGPVKFPSIPGPRQKLLAVASIGVIAGGVVWWALQQRSGDEHATTSSATGANETPSETLRVSLIPRASRIRVGDRLSIQAEVYNSLGQQLGRGQCRLSWRDAVTSWSATTTCVTTVSEPGIATPGTHHVVARAEGLGGLLAHGEGSVDVTVQG
jgi:hypothetical protein